MQQMADFKNGARTTHDPRKSNTRLMTEFAKAMTDEETKAAAAYFTAIPATPWIRVVETATVPKTRPVGGVPALNPAGGSISGSSISNSFPRKG